MEKRNGVSWAWLGRVEKLLLAVAALFLLLYFTDFAPGLRFTLGVGAFFLGVASIVRLARRALRNVIWRLRNRLIVAYLFIAVVPIILVIALLVATAYLVVGQTAVYLVNTELTNRMGRLVFPADAMVRTPGRDPEAALNRTVFGVRRSFPDFEILATGDNPHRYPEGTKLEPPPAAWRNASGLILKEVDGHQRLFAWAHSEQNNNEVTILAPITREFLTSLVPKMGDVSFNYGLPAPVSRESHVPPPSNALDLRLAWAFPIDVPSWEAPDRPPQTLLLYVDTRFSAVLAIIFGQKVGWSEKMMTLMVVVSAVFLLVEIASLYAGVKVTRTITGAVHELYEGTQHVQRGDFSYRIPVQGKDQVAELSESFNAMTENVGRLLVVAKEKERLESELAIAREVQNQLFPKSAPPVNTLELCGVCNPARMVSGDYYDFMTLDGRSLAFAIGDVAGKGISAALLMASIQSTMRTQLSEAGDGGIHLYSSSALVSTLNRQLYATTAPEKYATFYFALYDEITHALRYTNAGHLAPILMRGQSFEMLDSTGTVVGAFPVARYEEKTITLEPGDLLLAYTDGIVEPENAYGEQFGEDRVKDLLIKYQKADASELIARTMEAVVQWTGAGELQDDMTMVVARRI